MRPIAIIASLLLATMGYGQSSLAELRKVAESNEPDRFERMVQFIEQINSDSEAMQAMKLFENATDRIYEQVRLFAIDFGTPINKKAAQELNDRAQAIEDVIGKHGDLGTDEKAVKMIRELAKATTQQRISLIRKQAILANKDFPDDSEDGRGFRCHEDLSDETRLRWIVNRYQDEAVQALGPDVWQGRGQLLETLDCYGVGPLIPKLRPALIKLARDRNTYVRRNAISMLSRYPGEDLEPLLADCLQSNSISTKTNALFTAGKLKLAALETLVVPMVKDSSGYVRDAAIFYLGQIATSTSKQILLDLLNQKDLNFNVPQALAEAKCSEAIPRLSSLFEETKDKREQVKILSSLLKLDPQGARSLISSALESKCEYGVLDVIKIIQEQEIRTAIPALQRLLNDKRENIRKSARETLNELESANP